MSALEIEDIARIFHVSAEEMLAAWDWRIDLYPKLQMALFKVAILKYRDEIAKRMIAELQGYRMDADNLS